MCSEEKARSPASYASREGNLTGSSTDLDADAVQRAVGCRQVLVVQTASEPISSHVACVIGEAIVSFPRVDRTTIDGEARFSLGSLSPSLPFPTPVSTDRSDGMPRVLASPRGGAVVCLYWTI